MSKQIVKTIEANSAGRLVKELQILIDNNAKIISLVPAISTINADDKIYVVVYEQEPIVGVIPNGSTMPNDSIIVTI